MDWREREKKRLRASLETATYEKDGALYWTNVDRPVPMHVFRDAEIEAPAAQAEMLIQHTAAFLADYREAMKNHVPSGEEIYEMRAAFGEGETVMNVITGQRYQT